ncbi:hypothetical protein PHLCEN_2v7569 [Hermanssonia centrifuga]|uniref:ZZ-type domain-containing protein n=1 Tax=Hermanssonia centrifuga TaxID=98765 RepID=A0A2R6NW51_9APHY|nr:hypothetical protein PHLCEN_2v7569 [Hermanssonia centrifuga]
MVIRYRSGQKLNGIIYMHRISDCRLSGPSRRIFKLFQRLCGEEAFGNVVIVTNMWDKVPPEVGAEREAELETDQYLFKSILEKGGKMFRHNNTVPSAHMILLHLASKSPVVLRIQKELVDQSRSLAQTAVGVELNRQMSDVLDSRAGIFANNPAMLIREKAEALKQTMEVIEALEAEKAARVEAEKELGRLREEAEKPKDAGMQNIVHKSVWCDGCKTKPIFGVRHKCLQCKDYDLCTTCLCSPKLRASHDAKHTFFPVDTPKDLTAYQAEKLKLEAENPTHLGFQCDACQVRPIVGARNRCMNCRDFNLCQTCVSSRQVRLQHDKDHVFFPMDDPQKRDPNVPVTSFGMRPAP